MKKISRLFLGVVVVLLSGSFLFAADLKTGRAVMERVDKNDGSRNVKYSASMVLIDKNKNKRVRAFKYWRTKNGNKTKSMIKFTKPSLDKDIGLMTYGKGKGKSDQWLHLPAINDTKRILSSDKGKAFVGSDFYYEDFEKRDINNYKYKLLGSKVIKGQDCYIVEAKSIPSFKSAYTKTKSWIRKDNFVTVKSTFYVDGKLKKVLFQKGIKKIQGFWTVQEMKMITIRQKHKTIMKLKRVKYNSRIKKSFFTKRFLKRRL